MMYRISTYKELQQWSEAFVHKEAFGLFFLIGNPGHAKSFLIRKLVQDEQDKRKKQRARETLKVKKKATKKVVDSNEPQLPEGHIPEPLWIEGGAVSAFKLYQQLFVHMNEMVVLDDVDAVYSDRGLVRLLKALCQTERVKTIGWWTDNRQLDALEIPTKFRTKSRVCIIANEWRHLSEHVGSLMSRGVMVKFDPSTEEVFQYIKKEKIVTDKDILTFTSKHLKMIQRIDIRDLLNATEAKKVKLDWQDALAQSFGIRDMLLVERLSKDKHYTTNEQRVSDFMRMTGLSRPMYFKASAQLSSIKNEGASPIPLEGAMA